MPGDTGMLSSAHRMGELRGHWVDITRSEESDGVEVVVKRPQDFFFKSVTDRHFKTLQRILDQPTAALAVGFKRNRNATTGELMWERSSTFEYGSLPHHCAKLLMAKLGTVAVTLRHLLLNNCHLGEKGGITIGKEIARFTSLQTLDLSDNNIEEKAGVAVGAGIARLTNLRTLDLAKNRLGDAALMVIAESCKINPSLRNADVSDNASTSDVPVKIIDVSCELNQLGIDKAEIQQLPPASFAYGAEQVWRQLWDAQRKDVILQFALLCDMTEPKRQLDGAILTIKYQYAESRERETVARLTYKSPMDYSIYYNSKLCRSANEYFVAVRGRSGSGQEYERLAVDGVTRQEWCGLLVGKRLQDLKRRLDEGHVHSMTWLTFSASPASAAAAELKRSPEGGANSAMDATAGSAGAAHVVTRAPVVATAAAAVAGAEITVGVGDEGPSISRKVEPVVRERVDDVALAILGIVDEWQRQYPALARLVPIRFAGRDEVIVAAYFDAIRVPDGVPGLLDNGIQVESFTLEFPSGPDFLHRSGASHAGELSDAVLRQAFELFREKVSSAWNVSTYYIDDGVIRVFVRHRGVLPWYDEEIPEFVTVGEQTVNVVQEETEFFLDIGEGDVAGARFRPLQPGSEIGVCGTESDASYIGSAGCFVRANDGLYLLTAAHVCANSPNDTSPMFHSRGFPVSTEAGRLVDEELTVRQPASRSSDDVIGSSVLGFWGLQAPAPTSVLEGTVDAALVSIGKMTATCKFPTSDVVWRLANGLSVTADDQHTQVSGNFKPFAELSWNQPLFKVGRSTGLTVGYIDSVSEERFIQLDEIRLVYKAPSVLNKFVKARQGYMPVAAAVQDLYTYRNVVLIKPATGQRMGDRGDSGCCYFDKDGNIVGMHVIGTRSGYGGLIPIERILKAFEPWQLHIIKESGSVPLK